MNRFALSACILAALLVLSCRGNHWNPVGPGKPAVQLVPCGDLPIPDGFVCDPWETPGVPQGSPLWSRINSGMDEPDAALDPSREIYADNAAPRVSFFEMSNPKRGPGKVSSFTVRVWIRSDFVCWWAPGGGDLFLRVYYFVGDELRGKMLEPWVPDGYLNVALSPHLPDQYDLLEFTFEGVDLNPAELRDFRIMVEAWERNGGDNEYWMRIRDIRVDCHKGNSK